MEFNIAKQNIQNISLQRNILGVLLGIMLVGNMLLCVAIVTKNKTTVVVPANVNQEITVSDSLVSRAYLEEMTNFFLSLLLDLNSSNIDYKSQIILRYISPNFYQEMKNYFSGETSKYKQYDLITNFSVSELEINDKDLTVRVKGMLITYFGKNGFKQEPATYQIEYSYKGSKLLISKFGLETIVKNGGKNDQQSK